MASCSFTGCDRPRHSAGWCSGHYHQHRRGLQLAPLGKPCATAITPQHIDRDNSWRRQADCAPLGWQGWEALGPKAQKELCATCPVAEACLDDAVASILADPGHAWGLQVRGGADSALQNQLARTKRTELEAA